LLETAPPPYPSPKSGFKTTIPITSSGLYFQVKSLNGSSVVIGVSSVEQL
jgi:hypothetical protein